MGYKLDTPSLFTSFASRTLVPDQNIVHAQNVTLRNYDA